MVTLVGCANSYTLLFLCPIIYLNYFWCIKYQHTNIYIYENGKNKWEKKKKREFLLAGPGVILAHPDASARGRRPTRPISRETAGNDAVAWAHTSARGGVNGAEQATEGGKLTGARPPVISRDGSPPWVRFYGGGAVARYGRG
jgi:hypothetical protein